MTNLLSTVSTGSVSLVLLFSACASPEQADVRLCSEGHCSADSECEREGGTECTQSACCTDKGQREHEGYDQKAAPELVATSCCGVEGLFTYDAFFLGRQPSPDEFEKLKGGGVRTIVNLRHESEIGFDERALAGDLGMSYHNLAFKPVEELDDELLDRALALLREEGRPLLLHCKSGNRVGAIWLAYRVLDGSLDRADALEEARMVGLKSQAYEERVLAYLEKRASQES